MRYAALLAVALFPALAADWDNWQDWKYKDNETVKRSFDVPAATRKVLVDNVIGSIHVTGHTGSQVQVNVEKHLFAQSPEALEEAKRDVKLDLSQQGSFVRLYVDGPFRNNNGINYRGDKYYGYRVVFDYDIQVPRDTTLVLKTVSGGEIAVKGTTGDFEVTGVNGGIDMEGIEGSGKVRTVNGRVKVSFVKNPERESEFHTLNGVMDVYFQPPLNADLHFKTFNGGVYSDFDVAPLPAPAASVEKKDGGFIYRTNRNMSGRAGKGGPPLTFDGFNGAIRLHTKTL